jgi:uncharacterized protein (DUF362 family)
MNKVAAATCRSYEAQEVYKALRNALDDIGFDIPTGKSVLIKPNIMSQNRPLQHSITHFSVVDVLCELLVENGCTVSIGESIAFYQKGLTEKAFEVSGIKDVALKHGARLVPFENEELVRIDSTAKGIECLYIPKILFEADMIIDVCKLKTHSALRLSGALKNMFGCLPGGYKQKLHIWTQNVYDLSDVFLDIHAAIKPSLSIMDAIVSLDGGPSAIGKPVDTSRLLVSESAASLDLVACRILGYDPHDVSTLVRAKERGFIDGYSDFEMIGDLPGLKFRDIQTGYIPTGKTGKESIFVTDTYVNPKIVVSKCTKCMKCLDSCVVSAISSENGVSAPVVDTVKCINCYRCLGVCPEDAITISSTLTNKFMRAVRRIAGI